MSRIKRIKNTERPQAVSFNRIDSKTGKVEKTTVSDKQLENWFAKIESHRNSGENKSNSQLSDEFVSNFGLRSASDVIDFLKSQAGKEEVALITEQLIIIAENQEMMQQQWQEQQQQEQMMLAAMLLALIHKAEAQQERSAASMQQYQQLQAQQHERSLQAEQDRAEKLKKQDDLLGKASEGLSSLISDKESRLSSLKQFQNAIGQYAKDITSRYQGADKGLANMEKDIKSLEGDLETQKAMLNAKIEALTTKMDDLGGQLMSDDNLEPEEVIGLTSELSTHLIGLRDMKSVLDGNKEIFDANGKKTDDFSKASYIMDANSSEEIVKIGDKELLVPKGTDVNNMSQSAKNEAAEHFQQTNAQNNISMISTQLKRNQSLEKQFLQQRQRQDAPRFAQEMKKIESEMAALQTQLNKVQAAKANVQAELNKTNPNILAAENRQAAAAGLSAGQASSANALQNSLKLMQNNPQKNTINQFNQQLKNTYGNASNDLQKQMNSLTLGQPIQQKKMQNLMQQLGSLNLPEFRKQQEKSSENTMSNTQQSQNNAEPARPK